MSSLADCPAAEGCNADGESQTTVHIQSYRLRTMVVCMFGIVAVGCVNMRTVIGRGVGVEMDSARGETSRSLSASYLHDLPRANSALILVKPHAGTDAVMRLINQRLRAEHVHILRRGKVIKEGIPELLGLSSGMKGLAAWILPAESIPITEEGRAAFLAAFGKTWDDALDQDEFKNAAQVLDAGTYTARGLYNEWQSLTLGTNLVKVVSGVYVGKIHGVYIVNGFYPAMQNSFTEVGAPLRWLEVRWKASRLPFANFTSHVIGGVDDSAAADATSLRNQIYVQWEQLGLEKQPDGIHNSLVASDSPYTAWLDETYWTHANPATHPLAEVLNRRGGVEFAAFGSDNQVFIYNGKEAALREHVAGLDRKECVNTLVDILKIDEDSGIVLGPF